MAVRWFAVDARDAARIEVGVAVAPWAVPSIADGLARWRRRIEQRRMLAVILRSLLLALAGACALQVAALAAGRHGAGPWLLPAAGLALAAMAAGRRQRTTGQTTARLLDRDLSLGAGLVTALELEESGPPAGGRGLSGPLSALVLADGRAALGRSLPSARARFVARRHEFVALVAFSAVLLALLLLPARLTSGGVHGTPSGAAHPAYLSVGAGRPLSDPPVGTNLSGYSESLAQQPPPLAQVSSGATRAGGAAAGHSPYGGGIQNDNKAGAVEPVSRTVGPAGVKVDAKSNTASSASAEGAGSRENGDVGAPKDRSGTAGAASSRGAVQGIGPNGGPQRANAPAPQSPTGVQAGSTGGTTRGGASSTAAGNQQAGASRHGTPGGATAGASQGSHRMGAGVVPQLGAGTALPLQPGYEEVPGAKGAPGEGSSAADGTGGGASHRSQAGADAARGGARAGVAYVPPGASAVAGSERQLLLGYFGSFARVTASGW